MPQRIPQLDALRGLAILSVILHNTSAKYPSLHLQPLFGNGWMGVDLFFVLSGFLITAILVDTKHSEGYFKNFYARRCLWSRIPQERCPIPAHAGAARRLSQEVLAL